MQRSLRICAVTRFLRENGAGFSFDKSLKELMDVGPRAEVIRVDDGILRREHLERLMTHEATGLHVKGFYDPYWAKHLGKELESDVKKGKARNWRVSTARGNESSDVSTLGEHKPFNVVCAEGTESALDEYFDGVQREFRSRRFYRGEREELGALSGRPQLWPLDKLRLELDEVWSGGAGLAREQTGKMRCFGGGLTRIMQGPTRWKSGFIHVDDFNPLKSESGLFSANIYLQLPNASSSSQKSIQAKESDGSSKSNGALHLWPLGIRTIEDLREHKPILQGMTEQDTDLQIALRRHLGKPLKVDVDSGDLVVLCVQRPHAVIGFKEGCRISLQTFLQHNGPNERLLLDC